ncbi:hypothetical protein LguiB_015505 [Lonicera macranthoides]
MADGMCFFLVAKIVRDAIVPLVMPFVGQPFYKLIGDFERQLHMHLVQPLEGLSTDKLSPMVHTLELQISESKDCKKKQGNLQVFLCGVLQISSCTVLLGECLQSEDEHLKEAVTWTQGRKE